MSEIATAHETVRTSGPHYYDLDTLKAAFDTATGLIQSHDVLLNEMTSEQDGVVLGLHQGEVRLGFQEENTTKVTDDTGQTVHSENITYGAYIEADGDIALGASLERTQNMANGNLSFGAALDIATDEVSGIAAMQRTWETGLSDGENGLSSYSVSGGFDFSTPTNGGETNWNAAVLGDVTYNHELLSQFSTYAFAEAGIIADPSNVDAIARAGLGKETSYGDVRIGIDQSGGVSATLSLNLKQLYTIK